MNKITSNFKENTLNNFCSSQIHTYNESQPFSAYKKMFQANTQSLDKLSIQAETLLNKLAQKISLDQSKIQKNFIELSQIGEQIEETGKNLLKQKEIDNILRSQKEAIKHLCGEKKHIIQHCHQKGERQLKNFTEIFDQKQKQLQNERQSREENWSFLIDEFQRQINRIQKQFKEMRAKDDQIFQQNSVDLYNFQSKIKQRLEQQNQTRKKEHEMVVRLVSQCIQNIRYVY